MGIFIIEMNFYGIESWIKRMTEHHFGPFPMKPKNILFIYMYVYVY